MKIDVYFCPRCGKTHQRKIYESRSEGVADIFMEQWFPPIWKKKKSEADKKPLKEFCKELVYIAIYNYHKNRRRIRVEKDNIKPVNETDY